ncbi:probable plastidic glucose transporter 2 isoform X1 [Typha angustifolia]|uniref:probable plastidic glucose transporter 2 isoform X1 n=1 Tax=Typha angustifolia TaxID=59011 RepID=UPI003C2DF2EC
MRWKFNSSVYKRMPSKELTDVLDRGEESPDWFLVSVKSMNSIGQDNENPSWKLSLPHVCVATITSFLFGYHIGVVNEPLESISVDLGFAGNTLAEGLVVSMCLGGALVGCLFSGSIADGIGRCRAFQLSALPMIIGASLSASTTSLEVMLLGRFLVGTGMGIGPPVASLYVTEVSPSYLRGTYGSFIQIATCLGLLGALLIGIPVKEVTGWWRVCFWISAAPASLLAILMEFCAESPQWLYKCGRVGEAEAVFERLLGASHVKTAVAELSRTERADEGESIKYSELFYGRHFRVVFIGTTLFALQQLSGINAVFYFSSTVFKSAGVPSNLANICVGLANLSGSIVAMLLMDKLGRKVLLLGSFLGMAAAMGLQASAASFYHIGSGSLYLSVGGMLLFVLAFSLGAGPVPGLLLPEIFPNKIRAKAMALCMSVHWVVNFFVGLLFLPLLEKLGAQLLYSIFASFCLIAAIFVRRNVMETKGKTLQEIEISLLSSE